MKRGNPWDDIPFGSSGLRGGGGSDAHSSASASSSSGNCSSDPDHFIPIRILEQKLKNKFADQLNDMDMDFDFDPKQQISRMDFPERFKQAEEDFRSKVQRAKNNIPPPLIPSERLHSARAGSPFRDSGLSGRAHSPSPNSSSVRHIPIIVEGKQQSAGPNSQSQPSAKTSSSRNSTPPPKLDPIPMPPPPSHTADESQAPTPSKNENATSSAAEEPKIDGANPNATPATADESQSVPPPVKKPTPAASQLEKVEAISQDVKQLEKQVGEYTGTSKDKQYLCLDEELTRNLIKLDNIETEGKEDVRNARKACIKLIQKCISELEEKIAAKKPSNKNGEDTSKPVITASTPPVTKTEKPSFMPARKASSEPPFHRSEISIEVNQDEKTAPVAPVAPAEEKPAEKEMSEAKK
ncbi:unnamed protein product [Allacma fusca]|uniref:BAG domain-containing protein n=1 Tax=Allacma fusca TaxID=39272 RepID=A0A8J2J9T7_9HEXA|nr:unnamed protein product [Allacma fusca]